MQSERRTISGTTNRSRSSRELGPSTVLPTRSTQPSHTPGNREALHFTSYSHRLHSAASQYNTSAACRVNSASDFKCDRGNFGTEDEQCGSTGYSSPCRRSLSDAYSARLLRWAAIVRF